MSKKDDALMLALEALEVATTPLAKDRQEVLRAQAAIREALAEPTAAENNGGKTGWPPGLLQDDCKGLSKWLSKHPDARRRVREALADHIGDANKMAEQQAQGCDYCNNPQYAGIKCKNCGREQPAQQQEPVAWMKDCADFWEHYTYISEASQENYKAEAQMWVEKLRTSPPASKPLTDAQIGAVAADIWGSILIAPQSYQAFARAIEAAIKENI